MTGEIPLTSPRSDAGIYSNILRFVILFHFGYNFFSNVRECERFETNTGGEIMKITTVMGAAAVAVMAFAGSAMADGHKSPNGKAYGVYGCSSGSAPDRANPGDWLKALKASDSSLAGLNPKEIQEVVDASSGWKGSGISPTVGAMLDVYCGDDPS
jgi:hypothetical protein